MTSHATHISISTIGDDFYLDLDSEQVWDNAHTPETVRAPQAHTNGRSKQKSSATHPLSPHSPAHITGDGIAEGMPTRPSLQRVLEGSFGDGVADAGVFGRRSRRNTGSEWEGESLSSELGDGSVTPSDTSEVKQIVNGVEVLVHEITPTDSLAGVALKYNVPLATLRRTNKLWASDTIHLRSTLYIPVPKKPRPALTHSVSVPTIPTSPSLLSIDEHAAPAEPLPAHDSASTARDNERRVIPAEELSFFPPPKMSSALSPEVEIAPRRITRTSTVSAIPVSLSASPSGSPRPHTLLDIFRAMPDVSGVGRRSIDSLSMGSSARDEAEEAVVELEMDERRGRKLNEPMKPSPGMIIQRGGARGEQAEDEDDDAWI
ncbi:carbohydrate-binding module family 50 protein [Calocera viscosa TUFC12733]|uniref:Carbohydrate-binding module family 50 protein n=1 Tax=Calocera viscosa (strain TUFC12733) TaxID=1330018 RepID=A0A167PHF2_CALVF|nr:carbohydrate-binding module family 50 protein [Calocera viscosa TUFC12733]